MAESERRGPPEVSEDNLATLLGQIKDLMRQRAVLAGEVEHIHRKLEEQKKAREAERESLEGRLEELKEEEPKAEEPAG